MKTNYYHVLAECDQEAESTKFIEYSLKKILQTLENYINSLSGKPMDANARLNFLKNKFNHNWFSRKEYNGFHQNISTATASRDLLYGVEQNILEKMREKNNTKYQFI
jgi:Fic family protein